jgi:predicted transcriptional regulator
VTIHASDIIKLLKNNPGGMTTAQVAERYGTKISAIGGRLSKLADYGRIQRTMRHDYTIAGPRKKCCVWEAQDDAR